MRILTIGLAVLAACGGNDQKALDEARATWTENGSEAYEMTVERTQFGAGTDSVRVTVVAGGVRSAVRNSGGSSLILEASDFESWFTVIGVFDEIQAGLDGGAHDVIAEYDGETGYPISATIDLDQLAAEDDITFAIPILTIDPSG